MLNARPVPGGEVTEMAASVGLTELRVSGSFLVDYVAIFDHLFSFQAKHANGEYS